ncbi:MAG TPA: OmpH family outer membrane protein [Chryseolinea sp.]
MKTTVGQKKGNVLEWIFKVFVIAGLIVVMAMQFRNQGNAIVYVDAVKLVNGYKGMQQARKDYEAKASAWKANVDSLKIELEAKIKDYQKDHDRLSAKERALTEDLLRVKQEQFMNYQQVISEKIQKEDQELTTKVLGRVNDYIKRYGEEKGYEIIMAATQYGNIVYSKSDKDITEKVLEGLNKEMIQ